MMNPISRRVFIDKSSQLLGGAALGGASLRGLAAESQESGANEQASAGATAGQGGATKPVAWRYSICNEIMKDWDWKRQCKHAAELGYKGLEVAPFTLGDNVDDISADRRAEIRGTAEEAGLEILGLHWLLVSPKGLHTTAPDDDLRKQTWEYMVKLAGFCADLGGKVMIFGSPGQRSTQGISKAQAIENLTQGLRDAAPGIAEHQVTLLLEPLSSDQTDVVNTLGEAAAIVKDVAHPAVSAMFDFHNTADETEPLDELVRKHYDHIGHIQVQEMDGSYMGAGDGATAFLPALRAFRDLGYDKWVSLEVFNFEPGPEKIASVSIETLKKMQAQL